MENINQPQKRRRGHTKYSGAYKPLIELISVAGSQSKAGVSLGVGSATIRNWLSGGLPDGRKVNISNALEIFKKKRKAS